MLVNKEGLFTASYPDHSLVPRQATESWVWPGNEATQTMWEEKKSDLGMRLDPGLSCQTRL